VPKSVANREALLFGGVAISCSKPAALAVVVTVTLTVEDEVPLRVIELGDTEQVD
jgi:hypothetical protein